MVMKPAILSIAVLSPDEVFTQQEEDNMTKKVHCTQTRMHV